MWLNTVDYYRENDSDCYMLLLDASKAFDRVEYVKLNSDLRERILSPIVLRLLINMYVNQCLQVRWSLLVPDRFSIANGVKQGGVLSPILFSIYMDKLIFLLEIVILNVKLYTNMLEFSATQTISHYYGPLLWDLNKCYYYVKRM